MRVGTLNKLTASQAKAAGEGMHSDGGGLFLRVKGTTRAWVFRYTSEGRKREMGLGAVSTVTLAQARQKAAQAREKVSGGVDPIETRARLQRVPVSTSFETAANWYADKHEAGWRSADHKRQWRNSISNHAGPLLALDVAAITPEQVAECLRPIWLSNPVTAKRLQVRIELVLASCIARGLRTQANPATMREGLEHLLPKQRRKVMPHPAIPVDEAPAAFARIWQRRSESTGHAALVAIFLSALRSGEARGLTWSEIGEEVITIPEERTKTGKEHINPLTPRLEAHLRAQPRWSDSDLVFPGRGGKPITDDAPLRALDRCGLGAFTVHGLRACFRTWSGEAGYRRELGEYQLGHLVGSAAERAYARSSLVEGRRPMMQAWEDHLCSLL